MPAPTHQTLQYPERRPPEVRPCGTWRGMELGLHIPHPLHPLGTSQSPEGQQGPLGMGHKDKGGRESQAYCTELRSPGCDPCWPGTSPSQPEPRVGEGCGESPPVHTSADRGEALGLPSGKPGPKLEGTDAP